QEVVHGLVDPPVVRDEPVVDGAERAQYLAGDAGLLGHLAHGGLLRRFALLDVALGQRPEQPAAPVQPADQRDVGLLGIEYNPTGRGLVDRGDAPPTPPAPAPGAGTARSAGRGGHVRDRSVTPSQTMVAGGVAGIRTTGPIRSILVST